MKADASPASPSPEPDSPEPSGRSARKRSASKAPPPCAVVGYDGSESARAAVDWAVSTLPAGATIVLVYASRSLHTPAPPGALEDRLGAARACFDELVLEADEDLLARPIETEVSAMDPASALIDAADRHGAGAIVVGLDRHTRLSSAFGTVATELLRRSRIPVAAVPVA